MLRQIGVRAYAEYFCPLNQSHRFETLLSPIEAPPHGLKPIKSAESPSLLYPVYYAEPCEGDGGYLCLSLREGSPAHEDRRALIEDYSEVRGTITQKYSYTPWSHISFEEKLFKAMFKAELMFHFDYSHALSAIVLGSDGLVKEPRSIIEACDLLLMSRYIADKKCKTRDNLEVRFHDTLTMKVLEDEFEEHTLTLHSPDNPYQTVLSALRSAPRG
jgi:hypothetical protein